MRRRKIEGQKRTGDETWGRGGDGAKRRWSTELGGESEQGDPAVEPAEGVAFHYGKHSLEPSSVLGPADKVAIAYLVVIILLVLIFNYRIPWWWALSVGHAAVVALILLIARNFPFAPSSRLLIPPSLPPPVSPSLALSLAPFIRGWYPVALIPITYKELSYLIPLIHPHDFDAALAGIDHRLLGVHPTVWLERLTWPPLTEILQLTYSTYYFLPLILGVVLWRQGWFDKFYYWVFIVVSGFYISYLGYIAVPAIGPRFLPSIAESQTIPLSGVWLFQPVRDMLDRAEGITRDCFPSGHTELTLLVLIYARSFHKKVFWWLLPLGTGVIISTVYLRYHYVIDVVAGGLLAIIIVIIARPMYRALGGVELNNEK